MSQGAKSQKENHWRKACCTYQSEHMEMFLDLIKKVSLNASVLIANHHKKNHRAMQEDSSGKD